MLVGFCFADDTTIVNTKEVARVWSVICMVIPYHTLSYVRKDRTARSAKSDTSFRYKSSHSCSLL
jgi:hypothetical protein